MIACPVLRAILLKCAMPLPGALRRKSPLLLPGDRLLLGALRLLLLLRLLAGLLLLSLLSGLRVLLLRLTGLLRRSIWSGLGVLLLRLAGLLRRSLWSGLRVLLLRLRALGLRLLSALLRLRLPGRWCVLLLGLCLSALLLCRCSLRSFRRLAPSFLPCVRWSNGPENQKHGRGAGNSNELHGNRLQ